MELSEAREQLEFAKDYYEELSNAQDHKAFRKCWQAFRTCIAAACNVSRQQVTSIGGKHSHHHQAFNKVKQIPEIDYTLKARDAAFHKVTQTSELIPGSIQFRQPDKSELPQAIRREGKSVHYSAGLLLKIRIEHPQVKLSSITSRSITYDVPLNSNGTEHSATTLGKVVIENIEAAICTTEESLRDK
jgi:hypothetical protein|tara:strand:+ start:66 stop:629 length:564 start_codon:yes stop_codon:yes gene_type:complete